MVRINSENTCPPISSNFTEKNKKLLFKDKNINSIDINIIIIFFLLKKMPHIPSKNNKPEKVKVNMCKTSFNLVILRLS